MSVKRTNPSNNKGPLSNPAVLTAVITAIVGLLGTVITLYFNYLQTTRPLEIAATQTAEERILALTASAQMTAGAPTFTPLFEASATPTSSPAPTHTATVLPSRTPTRTPAPSEIKFCINSRSINVRSGPGTNFLVMGGLTFEDCLFFDARTTVEEATWLRISHDQAGYESLGGSWVHSDLVRPQDFEQLNLIVPTNTPTPTTTPEG